MRAEWKGSIGIIEIRGSRPDKRRGSCNVEGIRAGYLKIVKADTHRERSCGTRAEVEDKPVRRTAKDSALGTERGAFKVMAFHWRCYKFICHNLLYAALLAYLYMPARGHTQIPLARSRAPLFRSTELWLSRDDGIGRGSEARQAEGGRRHCSPVEG